MSQAVTFGPYSPVRQAGDYYYVSGQVGIDPATKTAAANVNDQTHQAFHNLAAVLANAGLSLNDVVKTTVLLVDMAHFEAMNAVYIDYFTEPRPARACYAVAELPRVAGETPLLVEIEAVAYKPRAMEQPDV